MDLNLIKWMLALKLNVLNSTLKKCQNGEKSLNKEWIAFKVLVNKTFFQNTRQMTSERVN